MFFSGADFSLSLNLFLGRIDIDFSVSSRSGHSLRHEQALSQPEERVATLGFVRKVEIYYFAIAVVTEAEVAAAVAVAVAWS
ncbi:hypothetical protein TIFTF001_055658 [Ficus carica]|uniref:Uncharacterized protein n=1 Tax=Ficus carica TaxID=3494 RepID=A0AA88JHX3_FICCA|nr:hypothetical protein TIFTF001_055658 [Ficus carica]